jgi:DNA-directed RNA polymerase specialized sigma24 family protein
MFISRGFSDAEHLADQTIQRVITLLPEVMDEKYEDRAPYFYRVAHYIILEARRRKEVATDQIPERSSHAADTSDEYDCLLKCLELLPREKRELILDYYLYEGENKIEHHRRMAGELGITAGALRTRAHHTRRDLEKCIQQCARHLVEKQNTARRSLLKRRGPTGNLDKERQP